MCSKQFLLTHLYAGTSELDAGTCRCFAISNPENHQKFHINNSSGNVKTAKLSDIYKIVRYQSTNVRNCPIPIYKCTKLSDTHLQMYKIVRYQSTNVQNCPIPIYKCTKNMVHYRRFYIIFRNFSM